MRYIFYVINIQNKQNVTQSRSLWNFTLYMSWLCQSTTIFYYFYFLLSKYEVNRCVTVSLIPNFSDFFIKIFLLFALKGCLKSVKHCTYILIYIYWTLQESIVVVWHELFSLNPTRRFILSQLILIWRQHIYWAKFMT